MQSKIQWPEASREQVERIRRSMPEFLRPSGQPDFIASPYDWFLFRCNSDWRKQSEAHKILKKMGYAAYCPMREAWRFMTRTNHVNRRKVKQEFPLLPGYMPIRVPPHQIGIFYAIKPDTIYKAIGFNGFPIRIPWPDMERMFTELGGGEHIAPEHYRYMENGQEFDEGDMVEVLEGPWEGHKFPVSEIKDGEVPTILKLFGKDFTASFQTWQLRKVF